MTWEKTSLNFGAAANDDDDDDDDDDKEDDDDDDDDDADDMANDVSVSESSREGSVGEDAA